MNEHLLAAARSISELPLVAAVHPPRHHVAARQAASLAQVRASTCTDLSTVTRCSMARASQLGNQDAESLKIARPA